MKDSKTDSTLAIVALACELSALNQQAFVVYEPVVDAIIGGRCTDVSHIEHTLDGLLDFAGSEGGLRLFTTLCRYYWQIDQAATAVYVNAYRNMWDNDSSAEVETSNNPEMF
jgi:hypothetical protein